MPVTLQKLAQHVVDSGLLTAAELQKFCEELPAGREPQTAQDLARELLQAGRLTRFQVVQIYEGKPRGLLMGEYAIEDRIGAGGMGVVFKARHRRMDRVVALKVLPPKATASSETIKRFQREVRAAARLNHPNIVAAYDASEHRGVHYLVMEFVDGMNLGQLAERNGPLPLADALHYVVQAAQALQYAHSQGVVHRDIKPANLLVDRQGTVKVLDMGLARFDDFPGAMSTGTHADAVTGSNVMMGTVDFMSPEQAENTRTADHRSDIYSLGCTLYYLLTGRMLYDAETVMLKLLAHRDQPISSIRDQRGDVPAEVEAVFRRMVAKRRDDRYPDMASASADLQACLEGRQPSAGFAPKATPNDEYLNQFFSELSQQSPGAQAHGETLPAIGDATNRPSGNSSRKRRAADDSWKLVALAGGIAVMVLAIGGGLWRALRTEPAAPLPDANLWGLDHEAAKPAAEVPPLLASPVGEREIAQRLRSQHAVLIIETSKGKQQVKALDQLPWGPFRVRSVLMSGSQAFGDTSLQVLSGLAGLEELGLDRTGVTDAGMASLESITSLRTLNLDRTKIKNAGVRRLAGLKNLNRLNLSAAEIDDESLTTLLQLINLKYLLLYQTRISDEGAARLRAALPECRVGHVPAQTKGWTLSEAERADDWRVTEWVAGLGGAPEMLAPGLPVYGIRHMGDLPMTDVYGLWKVRIHADFSKADLANLGQLKAVRILDWRHAQVTNATMESLPVFPNVTSFDLTDCPVSDVSLGRLTGFTALGTLNLSGTQVVGPGLAHLQGLPTLANLALNRTKLVDEAGEHLGKLPSLTELSLADCEVPPAVLDGIGTCERLTILTLSRVRMADSSVAPLAKLQRLTSLSLEGVKIGDAGAGHLRELVNIEALGLADTLVGDNGLAALAGLTRLRDLRLGRTPVGSGGLSHLASLESLTRLDLDGTQVTDEGLAHLGRMVELKHLQLDGTPITGSGLAVLSKRDQLVYLTLSKTKVSDEHLAALKGHRSLSLLSLDDTPITDGALVHLATIRQLGNLSIARTAISEEGLKRFKAALPNCQVQR